jgi:hypothetical protein
MLRPLYISVNSRYPIFAFAIRPGAAPFASFQRKAKSKNRWIASCPYPFCRRLNAFGAQSIQTRHGGLPCAPEAQYFVAVPEMRPVYFEGHPPGL